MRKMRNAWPFISRWVITGSVLLCGWVAMKELWVGWDGEVETSGEHERWQRDWGILGYRHTESELQAGELQAYASHLRLAPVATTALLTVALLLVLVIPLVRIWKRGQQPTWGNIVLSACVGFSLFFCTAVLWANPAVEATAGGDVETKVQWGILNYRETYTRWEDGETIIDRSQVHMAHLVETSAWSAAIAFLVGGSLLSLYLNRTERSPAG